MTDYDAIVVGSGAGGLGAALRMSQQGVSVLLLGGRTILWRLFECIHQKGLLF